MTFYFLVYYKQSIKFNSISNGFLQGITSINSKFFHFQINKSQGVHFQNMTIIAPGESPNTDGIHIGGSNDIIINKVNISTGDDCVSIGPGTSNVHISEVNCGPGHGISIGSLGKYQNEGDVNGVIVTNCNIGKTQNGLRIKSWAPSPPSKVFNVTFVDINVNYVENPIIIDQHYCPHSSCKSQVRNLCDTFSFFKFYLTHHFILIEKIYYHIDIYNLFYIINFKNNFFSLFCIV